MPTDPLYESDFYAWTLHQATLLREGHIAELDLDNLAEEVESLGRSQQRELESRLHVLLMHLLKWCYQPTHRRQGRSRRSTIRTQRLELGLLLRDNPSLRPRLATLLVERYPGACIHAAEETGLPDTTFPHLCPWSVEQVLEEGFWPENL